MFEVSIIAYTLAKKNQKSEKRKANRPKLIELKKLLKKIKYKL